MFAVSEVFQRTVVIWLEKKGKENFNDKNTHTQQSWSSGTCKEITSIVLVQSYVRNTYEICYS